MMEKGQNLTPFSVNRKDFEVEQNGGDDELV
jgi:hypothetical protein